MAGETNLSKLLKAMSPKLIDGDWVFVSLPTAGYGDLRELNPRATICKEEGFTFVPAETAEQAQAALDELIH